ncbi:MAG TPA: DUF2254 domain-containing protein [Mycobacteriales bacterium]|nr:DUF2254 domain-containing protein [Mycobacteriales bacterium]
MVPALLRAVWTSFWLVPAGFTVVAIGVGLTLVEVDQRWVESPGWLYPGGSDGARALLSAVTSSMISFTGLVFSITVVALQLTSSQFSPRVLRRFLEDRVTQVALGVFVATFVYAMTVLRSVRGESVALPFVPRLSTTVAFLFVLGSIVMFIVYIDHIANSLRAANVIATIGDQTRALLERQFPAGTPEVSPDAAHRSGQAQAGGGEASAPPARHVVASRPGVVTSVDVRHLVGLAARHDVVLGLLPRLGGFLPEGAPLVMVSGARSGEVDDARVRRGVAFGIEPTMRQDVGYGFRQLVDIAERALSPSTNDVTTAVQALDQLHDLVRRLATRPFPAAVHRGPDGQVRLVLPAPRLGDFVGLALDEITYWGKDSPRVQHHVLALLEDLHAVAAAEHRETVRRALEHHRAGRRPGDRAGVGA